MKQYLADLHIHTCLSPCGSLEMSPSEIVRHSLAKGLDAIAITDHNTTLQCPEIQSYLLLSALDQSVNQIAAQARKVDALFVAAHVERPSFSLISQLGFIDPCLSLDAIEYNNQQRYSKLLSIHGYLKEQTQYSASDAHYPEQIGTQPSIWQTEELTFDGLRKAFDQKDNHLIFASHG